MKHRVSMRRIMIILFWLAVWQLAGLVIRNDIIFASPADVALSLIHI